MDKIFEGFIEKLVKECLLGIKFAYLSVEQKRSFADKIRNRFYTVTIETLLDQLSQPQLDEIKDLDPESPELQQKLSEFAASIPGFAVILEDSLNKEMDKILQSGQVN